MKNLLQKKTLHTEISHVLIFLITFCEGVLCVIVNMVFSRIIGALILNTRYAETKIPKIDFSKPE